MKGSPGPPGPPGPPDSGILDSSQGTSRPRLLVTQQIQELQPLSKPIMLATHSGIKELILVDFRILTGKLKKQLLLTNKKFVFFFNAQTEENS